MKALILCAGLGTRLLPLTENFAKPSLPVAGIPTLWYSVWSILRELKPSSWCFNVSHRSETIQNALEVPELKNFSKIQYIVSDESRQILGSSGALKKIEKWIEEDILFVSNGDTICFPAWKKMLDFHRRTRSEITLHLRQFSDSKTEYTNIEIDNRGQVLKIGEKQKQGIMFSGSYIINANMVSRLPIGFSELRQTLLEPLTIERKLFGFREDVPWFDTGNLNDFFFSQFDVPANLKVARPLIESMMIEITPGVWVPKNWNSRRPFSIKANCPAIFVGKKDNWKSRESIFGPRYCGIYDYLGVQKKNSDSSSNTKKDNILEFFDTSYTF